MTVVRGKDIAMVVGMVAERTAEVKAAAVMAEQTAAVAAGEQRVVGVRAGRFDLNLGSRAKGFGTTTLTKLWMGGPRCNVGLSRACDGTMQASPKPLLPVCVQPGPVSLCPEAHGELTNASTRVRPRVSVIGDRSWEASRG